MTEMRRLYQRLLEASFPELGKRVGDFGLYDSILAGYAARLADGERLEDPDAAEVTADDETLAFVARLRTSESRSAEEQEFLDYFDLLEEVRQAIVAAAKGNTRT